MIPNMNKNLAETPRRKPRTRIPNQPTKKENDDKNNEQLKINFLNNHIYCASVQSHIHSQRARAIEFSQDKLQSKTNEVQLT